jgi:hypothetical protein
MSSITPSPTPLPEQLQYPWPPNLSTYEAKFFGVTGTEAVAIGMGLLLPVALAQSLGAPMLVGGAAGMLAALFVFLSLRKVGRFGGVSLPAFVGLWLGERLRRDVEVMELPLILGGGQNTVELEDWDGEVLLVLEEE